MRIKAADREAFIRNGLGANCHLNSTVSLDDVKLILGDYINKAPDDQMVTMAMSNVRKFVDQTGKNIVKDLKASRNCQDIAKEWAGYVAYFKVVFAHGKARGCDPDRKHKPQSGWVFMVTSKADRTGFKSTPIIASKESEAKEILSRTYKPDRWTLTLLKEISRQ